MLRGRAGSGTGLAAAARARVALAGSIAVAVALWRTRFQAVPTGDGTWLGVLGWPSPATLAASVAIGIAAALWLERYDEAVRAPFLALALAACPLVPLACGRLLFLLVCQGPVLFLVALAAACVAAARAWRT